MSMSVSTPVLFALECGLLGSGADEAVAVFVARAFGLALDIKVMLGWMHLERKVFVSDETRGMCWALLGSEKGPDDIVNYLREQGKELEKWRGLLGVVKW
jgi:hypothetical protein